MKGSNGHESRVGGTLILSARSDQFSDAAIGDVWDGIPVDDLARDRERELSRLVIGDMVDGISALHGSGGNSPYLRAPVKKEFNKFLIVSQGSLVAEGSLSSNQDAIELSFAETPNATASRLKDDALRFLAKCSVDSATGYCSSTLIDSKLIEWFVLPQFDSAGKIQRIELIHEGRFSGVRQGLHVLFE